MRRPQGHRTVHRTGSHPLPSFSYPPLLSRLITRPAARLALSASYFLAVCCVVLHGIWACCVVLCRGVCVSLQSVSQPFVVSRYIMLCGVLLGSVVLSCIIMLALCRVVLCFGCDEVLSLGTKTRHFCDQEEHLYLPNCPCTSPFTAHLHVVSWCRL